jgi:autotransporter-associated beta strand protein
LGTGTSTILLTNGGTPTGGTLELDNVTLPRNVTMLGGSTLRGSGTAAFTGTVTFDLLGTCTLATTDPADTLTIGDAPNDYTNTAAGAVTTVVSGPGTVALPFANNYTGAWRVDAGTLRIGSAASLGTAATPIPVNNDATLEIAGATLDRPVNLDGTATLRGIGPTAAAIGTVTVATTGLVTLASGAAATDVLTVGDAPNDLTGGSFASRITVAGAGKVKLTQPTNYVGVWHLGSGTLEVDADNRLGGAINGITLAGGTLAFTQSASTNRGITADAGGINVAPAALLTLNGPLSTGFSGGFNKSGPGTLRVVGLQSHSINAFINVDAGTLELFSPAGMPDFRTLALNVNPGGTLKTNQTQHLRALNIANNAQATLDAPTTAVIHTDTFTTAGSGKLDLTNDKLIVVNGDLAAIAAKVSAGYNGGAWNGPGIVTSVATSRTALGVSRATDAGITMFGDVPVTPADVLVAYTLAGDANLDAAVNFTDLVRVAQNYNTTGKGWWQGDFTYDTRVDFNDLVKLAQNYNATLPATAIPGAPASFEADLVTAFAQVPEPSPFGVAACGVAFLLCKRPKTRAPSRRLLRSRIRQARNVRRRARVNKNAVPCILGYN